MTTAGAVVVMLTSVGSHETAHELLHVAVTLVAVDACLFDALIRRYLEVAQVHLHVGTAA